MLLRASCLFQRSGMGQPLKPRLWVVLMLLRASCLFQLSLDVSEKFLTGWVLMLLRASCLFQRTTVWWYSQNQHQGLNAPSSFLSIPTIKSWAEWGWLDDVYSLNAPSSFLSIPTKMYKVKQVKSDVRLNAPSSFLSIPTARWLARVVTTPLCLNAPSSFLSIPTFEYGNESLTTTIPISLNAPSSFLSIPTQYHPPCAVPDRFTS